MKRRKTQTGNLTRLLGSGSTPLYVLNAQRRVLVFNRGCEELTGFPSDEVVGQTCLYGSGGSSALEELTAGMSPPPNVFQGETASVPAYLVNRDGKSLPQMLNFFPFCDGETGLVTHILAIVSPLPQPPAAVDATADQQLHAELAALRSQLRSRFGRQSIVCNSPATVRLLNQIELAQHCDAAVHLTGEMGTGKEHLARVIHYGGDFKTRAFVPLDCRRSAPSEADRTVSQLLETATDPAAQGLGVTAGSLFLRHVEHLSRDVQKRIVKAFRGEFPPTLRLFSSSTCELSEAVAEERLLPELEQLLTTMTIEVPPLRRRPEDLPLLAQYFLEETNREGEKQVGGFGPEVLDLFKAYNWPGNVDELSKVVREAHQAAAGELIQEADLPFRFRTGFDAQKIPPAEPLRPIPLEQLLSEYETELINQALSQCKRNKSQAADLLGVNRARLYRRMEALGIEEGEPDK